VRVIRTDTPLQALVLMNDTTYAEAAAALAERARKEGADPIAWAFEQLLARPPSPLEARTLAARLASLRTYYSAPAHHDEASAVACAGERADPPEAERAEIAALAGVMTVILDLDETLSRE
jgi:hypothetical protein